MVMSIMMWPVFLGFNPQFLCSYFAYGFVLRADAPESEVDCLHYKITKVDVSKVLSHDSDTFDESWVESVSKAYAGNSSLRKSSYGSIV